MKAYICPQYGPPEVLKLQEMPKLEPKDKEILIKIQATTVTSGDVRIRGAIFPKGLDLMMKLALGFSKPKKPILGIIFAGKVVKVGQEVKKFKKGDLVYGIDSDDMGCFGEYKVLDENKGVALKPSNLKIDQAAAVVFGAMAALPFVRDQAKVHKGHKVLVNGASSDVGTWSVQLSKYYGAEVTAVCRTKNFELVESLGASQMIDYTKEDFTKKGEKYDRIFDTVGNLSLASSRKSLKPKGVLLIAVPSFLDMVKLPWTTVKPGQKMIMGKGSEKQKDLEFITKLVESGKVKPVIDRTYPFDELVKAHRYVQKGHKTGSVVVKTS